MNGRMTRFLRDNWLDSTARPALMQLGVAYSILSESSALFVGAYKI